MEQSLEERDLRHLWYPCTQMKDHETIRLLAVTAASGCYIQLSDGSKVLDAISSWWCKSLGHQHPRIRRAVMHQMDKFEHVMLAGTTNEVIVDLSEQLSSLLPPLNKVLYAGDGSCAVEMALKLSLLAHQHAGECKRKKMIALQNAYHGETMGAMSVSDLGLYCKPYESLLFPVTFLPVPYVMNDREAGWDDCGGHWLQIEEILEDVQNEVAAIIVEPVIQGAAGMRIYSADFLRRLRAWTTRHGIHLIADEIMTGIGRTGKMLACEHAQITPDFLCLSKGLTSGWLPLSVTLTHQSIYDLFYDDDRTKAFLHSHTYAGNALAVAAALETLRVIKEENIDSRAAKLGEAMHNAMNNIAEETGLLKNVRGIGAVVAADVTGLHLPHASAAVAREAVQRGVLLRPLGETIYWLPPLVMQEDDLALLARVTHEALVAASE